MKRLMLIFVMILCLVPMSGLAKEETVLSLYPIRENGLWGYMNRQGETVIEPQWTAVWPFEGNTALVSIDENNMIYGIINRRAEWVLEPEYYILSYGLPGQNAGDRAWVVCSLERWSNGLF